MVTNSLNLFIKHNFCLIIIGVCSISLYAQTTKTISTNLVDKNPEAVNFIVMGDFGRMGEDHQLSVAKQMGKTAKDISAKFIISTGDNFYPNGVASKFDPLWKTSFEDIYTDFSLQKNGSRY